MARVSRSFGAPSTRSASRIDLEPTPLVHRMVPAPLVRPCWGVAHARGHRVRTRSMMFERFTEKAVKVIMLAQEESKRMGHSFVGTEQMLLGLLQESSGEFGLRWGAEVVGGWLPGRT